MRTDALRVLFVVTRADAVGGANVHVRDLAVRLLEDGHDALVVVGGSGPVVDDLSARGVPFRQARWLRRALHPLADVLALREIAAAIRDWRPNVLSLHTAKAGALGRLAVGSAGPKPLYTPHGWSFTGGVPTGAARRYRAFERWLARRSAVIVDVCEHDRALALRAGVGRPEDHVVVHNGVTDVKPAQRADPGRSPPRVVMVARLDEQKDPLRLLDALAAVGDETPWTLELVGDGPDRARVEQRARALGLAARVTLAGAVLDVVPHLASAQLFVLLTRWEGFPRSILEAMRAGLPVIASDVAGVREAVTEGVTGLVVPPRDTAAATAALLALLGDADLRRRFGTAGRRRYEQAFTFERMYQRYLSLYRSGAPEAPA